MNHFKITISLYIKLSILILFFIGSQDTYCQENKSFNTKYSNSILKDSVYSGKVILFEHWRGKLHLRLSRYLKNQKYIFSDMEYIENSVGDFNKNGVEDICVKIHIKRKSRDESYICFLELKEEIVTVYSYFELSTYSDLTVKNVQNDTLHISSKMWGTNGESFLNRTIAVIHDENSILRIVTPSKLENMKDINIFKSKLENIERESFISNNIIRTQYERYKKDNLSITAELSGFNDFNLRFTIVASSLPNNFKKEDFIFEIFEFLESNTRFPSILTKIENKVLIKNEDGEKVSNNFKYNIKNYITSNSYFIIGENKDNYNNFLFDIVYAETDKVHR